MKIAILASLLCFLFACGDSEPETTGEETTDTTGGEELPPDVPPENERPEMTTEACESQGGSVVGDIGDGAVHRPDYVCPNGSPPIGTVPLGVEGSVCCGQ
jgi:hypothetical protein